MVPEESVMPHITLLFTTTTYIIDFSCYVYSLELKLSNLLIPPLSVGYEIQREKFNVIIN